MKETTICVIFIGFILNKVSSIDQLLSGDRVKNWCDFEIDSFNCLNVNCNKVERLKKLPESIFELADNSSLNRLYANNVIFCSLDVSETGITQIEPEIFENFDVLLLELIRLNPNQSQTNLKIFMSNIEKIKEFKLPNYLNTVLFLRDSNIKYVQPKSLSSTAKLELNLIGLNMTYINWFHLLDSAKLKLLSLRNIPNLKDEMNGLSKELLIYPISSINDVKIYNTYLPIIDDNFFLFKVLKFIEQLELNSCSISFIKNSIFEKYSNSFRHLKYLSLVSNNLNKISDQTFNGLINLVSLDLDDNPIEYIQPNAFSSLKKLKTLSVSSNTIKSMSVFNSNPLWIFSTIKTNKQLNKLSFRTNQLLKNTCLLKTIIETIQDMNMKIFENLKNKTSKIEPLAQANKRTINLFSLDQLNFKIENLQKVSDIFCSVYLVCHFTKYQDEMAAYNIWFIETFKSCPLILIDKRNENCLTEKKIQECDYSKSKSRLMSTSKTLMNSSASICEIFLDFVNRFKWIFISIGLLVSFFSMLFCVACVCFRTKRQRNRLVESKSRYDDRILTNHQIKNKKIKNNYRDEKLNLDLNQPADYYVVLIEKD